MVLALALALIPGVLAEDPVDQVNQTVEEKTSILDGLRDGVSDAAGGVGDAVTDAGKGFGSGVSAVGRAIASAARFVGSAAASSVSALSAIGLGVGDAAAAAMVALGEAAGQGLASLGQGAGSGSSLVVLASVHGVGAAALAVANGIGASIAATVSGLTAYAGVLAGLRPAFVPVPVYTAVAGAGVATVAASGGWAGFEALRRWGLIGSGMAGVGGFSRIQGSDVLQHPLRDEIFNLIQAHPGIHASQIARETGAGWGTVTHHLDKLQKATLVTTRSVNNQKCYFEQGGKVSRSEMTIAGALKGDTASNIAAFVTAHPMTSQKQLAESTGLSAALVSFHVKKLANLGVLEKVRHGKETLLTTSESMRRLMAAEADPVFAAAARKASAMEFGS
jgi:DNA-binding MarR family transcriptional regulator